MRPSNLIDSSNSRLEIGNAGLKTKKKGSWLSKGRSAQRLVKQRSLTKVVSFKRVPSIKSTKKEKKVAAAEEARDMEEMQHREGGDSERHPPSLFEPYDDDTPEDDDESHLSPSDIYHDRSLHSLSPFEKDFINNTMTRIHAHGYGDQMDVYSIGILLKEICASEKPFGSLLQSHDEFRDDTRRMRPKFNIDPLWSSLEHSLSRCESAEDAPDNAVTEARLKRLICSVLNEMNVKLIKGDGSSSSNNRRGRYGTAQQKCSWGDSTYMSWNSLTYCQCIVF